MSHACRHCDTLLEHTVVDLGMSPLCESFLDESKLSEMEPFYPLEVFVCHECWLVQVPTHVSGESIFGGDYAYFSSYSDSWLRHCEKYVGDVTTRFGLGTGSQVVEIASNDGYLLQFFVAGNIPALGIEPAGNVAAAARERGVETLVEFFGETTAAELVAGGMQADLLVGNNVLAHVPDLNDFVRGLKTLLSPRGVISLEFPHLVRLIEGNQFDTIYQEHYCYFSLSVVSRIFASFGLRVFDVEELSTHGGSLRVFARHSEDETHRVADSVAAILASEAEQGYSDLPRYQNFGAQVAATKHKLLQFLIEAKQEGRSIAGYGAPGKGNTLLNYCGVRQDFLDFVVDRNPFKHGKFLPGTHIPVFPPEKIAEARPDYILILPWNLRTEISEQLAYTREWGAKLVVPIPRLEIF